jgi:hypothetical protein
VCLSVFPRFHDPATRPPPAPPRTPPQIYPLPNVVMLFQMAVTAVLLESLLRARVLAFQPFHWAR